MVAWVYVKKINSINAMVFLYYLVGCINDGVIIVRATCINNNNNNNNWFFYVLNFFYVFSDHFDTLILKIIFNFF